MDVEFVWSKIVVEEVAPATDVDVLAHRAVVHAHVQGHEGVHVLAHVVHPEAVRRAVADPSPRTVRNRRKSRDQDQSHSE